MPRTLINPPELHPAPGFSHVAIAAGDKLVCFAGQVALDAEFRIIGAADLFEQTKAAMRNLLVAMEAADVTWDDIVRRRVHNGADRIRGDLSCDR